MEKAIPRPEYPRPQMVRSQWMNLNGPWEFEMDFGSSGRQRRWFESASFTKKIVVPFCPESRLSGIGYTDFMPTVWYRREVSLPAQWREGGRVLLHIGACDYHTEVWVNGQSVGTHSGGYMSFSFDITDQLKGRENVLVICADDHLRSRQQPAGKQSLSYYSEGCFYTRTTGIWQTVWLEWVPDTYIRAIRLTPDLEAGCPYVEAECASAHGRVLKAEAFLQGKPMGKTELTVVGTQAKGRLELAKVLPWGPGSPTLYDLCLELGEDRVESYFGMRSIAYHDRKFYLNGKPVFQRLVLDQGFYPDGIYTAPDEEELIGDIRRSMDMGFNGARLHEKIFEPRFLYHCDRMGYLVWGEHGNWGLDLSRPEAWRGFLPEWLEAVRRDYSHPSIVGWCPLNETQGDQDPQLVNMLYEMTKAVDSTRPFIDASGWTHVRSDLWDCHDYDQNPETFRERYRTERADCPFVSEYGGIWWDPEQSENGWGYGDRPRTEEEFIERYRGLTEALLDNEGITGFCYTQLTDVEQEVNGLYTYDRRPKFDPAVLHAITSRKAAIEE